MKDGLFNSAMQEANYSGRLTTCDWDKVGNDYFGGKSFAANFYSFFTYIKS